MRVLLTNDDGIEAEGLQVLRRALLHVPGIDLAVIAPDSNRSATARSITTRRPMWVERIDFGDGTVGYATDGTPVDCVRFAKIGLIEGFDAQLIVSGINHGGNLGEDITYSGTVAAAFEGIVLGIPAIALSQQSVARETGYRLGAFDFSAAAAFTARMVQELSEGGLSLVEGTLLNVNFPAGEPSGVEIAQLGRRIYRDALEVEASEGARTLYRVYGDSPDYHDEPGTDLAAVAAGRVSVTPLHFDLTHSEGMDGLRGIALERLLAPAAEAGD